jgi:hypothetical protein
MTLLEKLKLFNRLHGLISRKATGTPEALAARLDISERKLYRMLEEMKNFGFPIQYCSERQSYCYGKTVRFSFDLCILDKEEANQIEGGTFFNFLKKNFTTDIF